MRFNALKTGASFALFLLLSFSGMEFHMPTALFAVGYGLALFFSTLFGYFALMNGSMALTSLIVSYSVIIPCFYGIVFLKEQISAVQILGFILLAASMWLIMRKKGDTKTNKKWFAYVAITFLCNGICSVVQKMHQTMYPLSYCSEFMLYSIFITFILFFLIASFTKERNGAGQAKYAVPAGILMGLGNYLTLVLSSRMNATILFPIVTIFSIVFNILASRLFFKDKLSGLQLIGICLGVLSVLLIK